MASELHVLIVGAGIGGLMLGLLLEKANISYEIFEQASELKPLGSAVTVGSVMHIFEQLGMYKEMLEISKPFGALRLRDTKLDFKGSFQDYGSGRDYEDLYGDYTRIVARPDLVNLLLKRIPSGRIHYSKRVQKTTQDESEAVVHCHDDTKYSGTIVVGADGAYSGIRQEMYKELDAKSALPRDDAKPTVHGYDCVVGMTKALNPKVHPILEDMFSEFEVVLNKEISLTCWFMPLTGNRMGWMIIRDVRNEEDDSERNAESPEWGPDTALDMCDRMRHLPCPYGGTIGNIIDNTSKDHISRTMLEDKYFSTWYQGRTVLLGDACHQMLPFGGMGTTQAIVSAVSLTNLLYGIQSVSQSEITRIFKEYFETRHMAAKTAVDESNRVGTLLHKKGSIGDFLRYMYLNWIPRWLIRKDVDAFNLNRPQVTFLPFVKFRGTIETKTNEPSRRMALGSDIPLRT